MSSDIEYMAATGITDSKGNVNESMMGSMEDMYEDLKEWEEEEAQAKWEAEQANVGVNKKEQLNGEFIPKSAIVIDYDPEEEEELYSYS